MLYVYVYKGNSQRIGKKLRQLISHLVYLNKTINLIMKKVLHLHHFAFCQFNFTVKHFIYSFKSRGQGSQACGYPWGQKESDMT